MKQKSLAKKEFAFSILFLLPALAFFIMIVYYPLLKTLYYSFTDYYNLKPSYNFVGIQNFVYMMSDKYVQTGISNTFKFVLFASTIANAICLALAMILNTQLKTKNYLRAVFYIPCLLSPVVISGIFGYILQYNGVLNSIWKQLGLSGLVVDWFSNIPLALPMIMTIHVWEWSGFGAVIYLAGLQSIPQECIESATIDGASKGSIFFRVTLPLLMPALTINTFMSITGGFKLFDLPFILTNGGPANATETIATQVYRIAFRQGKLGYATAISITLFFIIALISITQILFMRKREVEL